MFESRTRTGEPRRRKLGEPAAPLRAILLAIEIQILYGAATFSEDIDLWVEPSQENLERLAMALRASGATYYKLTPELTALMHGCPLGR